MINSRPLSSPAYFAVICIASIHADTCMSNEYHAISRKHQTDENLGWIGGEYMDTSREIVRKLRKPIA